jgi:hypothetical protein
MRTCHGQTASFAYSGFHISVGQHRTSKRPLQQLRSRAAVVLKAVQRRRCPNGYVPRGGAVESMSRWRLDAARQVIRQLRPHQGISTLEGAGGVSSPSVRGGDGTRWCAQRAPRSSGCGIAAPGDTSPDHLRI